MNDALNKLYGDKWSNLIKNSKDTMAAYPLLLKVDDEYQNAEIRVMIVGQETDKWAGQLDENNENISALQTTYYEYLHESKDKNRRPFWNRKNYKYYEEELTKRCSSKKISFIWNNVNKIGNKDRGMGKPTEKIIALERQYFNVFEEEIKILRPHIVIFTIGDRYIPASHNEIKRVCDEPVRQVILTNHPNIIAVRTYHPNAKIKGGKKHLKIQVLDLICELMGKNGCNFTHISPKNLLPNQ